MYLTALDLGYIHSADLHVFQAEQISTSYQSKVTSQRTVIMGRYSAQRYEGRLSYTRQPSPEVVPLGEAGNLNHWTASNRRRCLLALHEMPHWWRSRQQLSQVRSEALMCVGVDASNVKGGRFRVVK